MSRVFSWKINDYNYGYLYIPNSNSLITSRITNENILSEIANEVSSWSESEYVSRFNTLNNEIMDKFNGASIEGSALDYFGTPNGTYIVLTGKDGANAQPNTAITSDVTNKITALVNAALADAKQQLFAENEALKAWLTEKITTNIQETSAIVTTAQESFVALKDELDHKVDDAADTINTAASLFDLNGTGINKVALQGAINKSNQALVWIGSNEHKINTHTAMLDNVNTKITSLESATARTNQNLNEIADTMNSNFISVNNEITRLSRDVHTVKEIQANSHYTEQSTEQEQALSMPLREAKLIEGDDFIETETIDNGDGTFTNSTKLGGEEFSVTMYGFGGKLNNENKKNGMSIASNGFRYISDDGTEFSMIDGMLKMSNASGSGKIEITEEGLFLNGHKYGETK